MSDKLELKHLAPYLPYGLKGQRISRGNFTCDPDNIDVFTWTVADISIFSGKRHHVKSCKPILRPLSDLTKEIEKLDFKAENKVQFTHYNSLPNQLTITATYKQMGEVFTQFIICRNSFDLVNYWIVEKLIEWHFDVFGLIEKGLAIDINTL